MADARTIVEFKIDMALESEGTVLNRETILNGVSEGLSDPAKGTYYLIRTENGQTAGSLFLTKEWSDWNNGWYWWIQSVFIRPEGSVSSSVSGAGPSDSLDLQMGKSRLYFLPRLAR